MWFIMIFVGFILGFLCAAWLIEKKLESHDWMKIDDEWKWIKRSQSQFHLPLPFYPEPGYPLTINYSSDDLLATQGMENDA